LSFLTVPNLSFENFLGLVLTTKIPWKILWILVRFLEC
jgi:hypothetical protein